MEETTVIDPETTCCATRYPILLVHGVGIRDNGMIPIWGRIPEMLHAHGAEVYFGRHDAWGTPLNNAVQLLERLPAILERSGAEKINIIAHSKGGLDSRYLIALLSEGGADAVLGEEPAGQFSYSDDAPTDSSTHGTFEQVRFSEDGFPIASLTTIATPHHGVPFLDFFLSMLGPLFRPVGYFVNRFYRTWGDENPDFASTCKVLSAAHMEQVNARQPSLPHLYSQQFGSKLHGVFDYYPSVLLYTFIRLVDGHNDGLVSLDSTPYDNYRGELKTGVGRGIPHASLTDVTHRRFSILKPPGTDWPIPATVSRSEYGEVPLQVGDILDFYKALTIELKARGL